MTTIPYVPSYLRDTDYCRPALVIDVRDYGAVGNAYQGDDGIWRGTRNDVAINNAIAEAYRLGGARVVARSGKYLCHDSILPLSNVVFESDGGTLILSGESVGKHLVRVDDAHNVRIEGWILDGNKENRPVYSGNYTHCIRFHNCIDYAVDQVDIYRSTWYSISNDVSCISGRLTRINIYDSRADGIDVHNSDFQSGRLTISQVKIDGFGEGGPPGPEPKAAIHMRGQGIDLSHFEINNCKDVTLGNMYGVLYGNGEDVRAGQIAHGRIDMGKICLNGKAFGFNNRLGIIDDVIVFADSAAPNLGTHTAFTLQSPNVRLANSVCIGKQVYDDDGNLISTGTTLFHGVTIVSGADNCVIDGCTMSDCGESGYFDQAEGTIFETNAALDCGDWGFDLHLSTGARGNSMNTSTDCVSGHIDPGTDTQFDQVVSESSTPTLTQVLLTDPPTAPQHAVTKAYFEGIFTGRSVLAQSGTAVSVPATTAETALATVTIPGGLMQPGDRLEIFCTQSHTSSGNNKLIKVRLGGMSGTPFLSTTITANATSRYFTDITIGATVSAQSGWASNNGTFGTSGSAIVTGAKNMAVDQDLVITGEKASSGETLTLENYSIRYIPAPV